MLKQGDRVRIGQEYARRYSYHTKVGREAIIYDSEPEFVPDGCAYKVALDGNEYDTWYIHEDDCCPIIPQSNHEARILLDQNY